MTKQLALGLRFIQPLLAWKADETCTTFFAWGILWDEAEVQDKIPLLGMSYTFAVIL